MSAARFQKIWFGLVAIAGLVSMWATPGLAYTADQQQACTGDAFRLCSSEIPDIEAVKACMVAKKAQLSPGCRAFFKPDPEPELTPVDAATPPSAKPMRKHVTIHAIKLKKKRKPANPDDAS